MSPLFVTALMLGIDGAPAEPDDLEATRAKAGKPIEGRMVASLVTFESMAITLESDDLSGPPREEIDGTLVISAEVSHDFDGGVRDPEFDVAVMSQGDLEFVWRRLHTSPLRLTTAEVERELPYPMMVVSVPGEDMPLSRADVRDVAVRESFSSLPPPRDGVFAYLAALSGYALETPSDRDVLRIIEAGGPADLAALAGWAATAAGEGSAGFDEDACARIMDAVTLDVRRLRAPPAFGDFQRLNALTAMAVLCARPRDLERMLALQRPMTILLSAAQVSYDAAAGEENVLGVSVHGFRRLQSRSDSALAWEHSLRRLRTGALDRLVRLAFEPVDFRDAPPRMQRRAVLQVQAAQLLLPLTTTQVERVLAAATERPEMQRELLRFYVEVRHAPAVEPLVAWLTANPRHIDDLGVAAVAEIGDRMLPVLMRRFEDLDVSMSERATLWSLLAALPEQHAPQLAALCASMAVEVPATPAGASPSVAALLQALRGHEREVTDERIDALVKQLAAPADSVNELRAQLDAARRLAELAPDRVRGVAEVIVHVHVTAARALDADFPAERRAALRQLTELPLGEHLAAAARTAASTDAGLAVARGEVAAALERIESFDPGLTDAGVRTQYRDILTSHAESLLAAGAWDDLEPLLDRADAMLAGDFDVESWRARLDEARSRPMRIAGAVLGVALLVLALFSLHTLGAFAALHRRIRARRRAAHDVDPMADVIQTDDPDADDAPLDDPHSDAPVARVEAHDREDHPDATVLDDGDAMPGAEPASDGHLPSTGDLLGDSWSGDAPEASQLDDFAA